MAGSRNLRLAGESLCLEALQQLQLVLLVAALDQDEVLLRDWVGALLRPAGAL
jgi:hypothetical protein